MRRIKKGNVMKTWFYIVAVEDAGWYNVAIKATRLTVVAEFARLYPHARMHSIQE